MQIHREVSACTGPDSAVCISRGEVRMSREVWVRGAVVEGRSG